MLAVSIILVCVASGFTLVTSIMKDMRKILLCIVVACITTAVNYLLSNNAGGLSGFATYIIATAVAVTSGIFAIKKKAVPMSVIVIYCLAYTVTNILTWADWYTILAILGAITGVICNTRDNGMSYHIWVLANSFLWCCYDVFAQTYAPLAQHLIFTAIFMAGLGRDIYKLKKEKKQNGCNTSNN